MKRKLNGKLLLGLVGMTALAGVGVFILHSFQVKRSAAALLVQADRAEKEGKLDKAEDYLRRYLVYKPEDVDALVKYGQTLEQRDQTDEGRFRALQVYQKAVQFAGQRLEVRRRVVDLALQLAERNPQVFSTARSHVEVLLQASPEDGELLYRLGRCEEGTGRYKEAAALYEKARQQDPTQIEVYTRLADLLRGQLSDPDQADRVMDARQEQDGLIARNGQSAAAYLARARYRRRFAIPDVDPAADVARALELAPDDAGVLLAAAESARSHGDIEAARGHLRHGLEWHPRNAALYQGLAELEFQAGRPEDAITWFRQGIQALAEDQPAEQVVLGWALADTLIQLGRPEEADEVIATLGQQHLRLELRDYLKARALVARQRWAEAARALEAVVPALRTSPEWGGLTKRTLVLLGQCYERLGNTDRRFNAWRRAVAIDLEPDPLWAIAHLGLAAVLVDLNRWDEALEQYRIASIREPGAGLALARLQILRNLRRPTEDQDRYWQEVERTLDSIESQLDGAAGTAGAESASASVTVLRAETLAARGQFHPARQLLEQALKTSPDQIDLWVALANLAGREGTPEATLPVLDDAQRRLGDRIELRLARTGYWVRHGGDEAAEALAKLEPGPEDFATQDRALLWRELAQADTRIGQDQRAATLWRRLVEQQPDDLDARINLFKLAVQSGDEAAAQQALDQVRRIEGEDGALWRYGKAALLIQRAEQSPADRSLLAEARRELLQAAARRPSWSLVPLALARVEELSGNPEEAISHYLRAILELGERNPEAIGRALQLLNQQQRLAEAAQVVRKLKEERVPLSGELQRLVAQVSFQTGDPSRALELAQKAVSNQSTDPAKLIWLGQIQWAAGQDAAPAFRRALALDDRSPKAWLALILYLAGTGQTDEAQATLHRAEQTLPEDQAPLVLAQGYEAVGEADRAEELYRQALKAQPDDIPTLRAVATHNLRVGHPTEAGPLLERIIQLGGATTDAAWARRLLATITALGGGQQRSLKALEILGLTQNPGQGQATAAATPEDLRTKAKILALQPSHARQQEAIAILDGLIERKIGAAEDLFLLAQLHETGGDWPKARQRMLELLNAQDQNPTYLAHYIRALLRHHRADEARAYVGKLEQLAPGQPGTVEIQARVLTAQGQADQAIALLTDFARGDAARLGPVAQLLEELSQTSAAEAMYRQFVTQHQAQHPEAVLALAGFLGRQGQTKQALDLLDDQAWRTIPAATIANASVVILFVFGSDPSQYERVESRLEAAIRAHPDQISIQFDLANVRILQGRYADAEAIFRAVHQRAKTLGAPLNNLACLLALEDGKGSEALALAQQAIDQEGENPDFLDTRALAYLAMDRADAAIRDLESALAVRPAPLMYFHLAQAYQKAGRHREAREAFRKAEDLKLRVEALHPLERTSYTKLRGQLTQR